MARIKTLCFLLPIPSVMSAASRFPRRNTSQMITDSSHMKPVFRLLSTLNFPPIPP
jgi:hypothetical protein